MPSMTEITCACGCGRKKEVRTADVKRGWGRYYSKSCKAKAQTKRTGRGGNRNTQSKETQRKRYDQLCNAHACGRVSDEYFYRVSREEYSEFMSGSDMYDAYLTLDIHPFSDEAFDGDY